MNPHEFADSANNGPWGAALTSEFIPHLEARYRLDPRAEARFLNGHSSGGWATLWLQVTYPKIFGGTWSTSPDSSDFHDWSGIDLYAPHANVYRKGDGTAYPIVRDGEHIVVTLQQAAQVERVLGPHGGQFSSFDYVFSPRGADGLPLPMFDRLTGAVNPGVVSAWQRYDIVHTIQSHWPELQPDLDGKIHVYVGKKCTLSGRPKHLAPKPCALHASVSTRSWMLTSSLICAWLRWCAWPRWCASLRWFASLRFLMTSSSLWQSSSLSLAHAGVVLPTHQTSLSSVRYRSKRSRGARRFSPDKRRPRNSYSHSMVPGGLLVRS